MPLSPPPIVDTRHYFRPVSNELVALLRRLSADDWQRPTLAGAWAVRDVVSHLVDLMLRRVSFHRDRMPPPPPPFEIRGERDFVRFINAINHDWVAATKRLSPEVLTELFELASADLAGFVEQVPLEAPALFGVSWAGEQTSEGWFDLAREFTELWHHQMQIRLAAGRGPLSDPKYLHAVLEVSMRALPHTYRDTPAAEGTAVTIEVEGEAGGAWALVREAQGWCLFSGLPDAPAARVRLTDDEAWRLLFNALPEQQASGAMRIDGMTALARPLLGARAIVV